MTTAVLEREEPRAEWNHSCTPQCPNPCPASNVVELPQPEVVVPIVA